MLAMAMALPRKMTPQLHTKETQRRNRRCSFTILSLRSDVDALGAATKRGQLCTLAPSTSRTSASKDLSKAVFLADIRNLVLTLQKAEKVGGANQRDSASARSGGRDSLDAEQSDVVVGHDGDETELCGHKRGDLLRRADGVQYL